MTPPGDAREDWKIIRAASEVVGRPLPYDSISGVRKRMAEIAPTTVSYDVVEKANFASAALELAKKSKVSIVVHNCPLPPPCPSMHKLPRPALPCKHNPSSHCARKGIHTLELRPINSNSYSFSPIDQPHQTRAGNVEPGSHHCQADEAQGLLHDGQHLTRLEHYGQVCQSRRQPHPRQGIT